MGWILIAFPWNELMADLGKLDVHVGLMGSVEFQQLSEINSEEASLCGQFATLWIPNNAHVRASAEGSAWMTHWVT